MKQQHNCVSEQIKYSGKFIPTEHEFLVIIKKSSPYIIPITITKHVERNIRNSEKSTWAYVIAMVLEDNGGSMNSERLVDTLNKLPKAANNHFVAAKLRQTLQRHPNMFERKENRIFLKYS